MSNLFEDSRDEPKGGEIQRGYSTKISRMIQQEEFQKRGVDEGQSSTLGTADQPGLLVVGRGIGATRNDARGASYKR